MRSLEFEECEILSTERCVRALRAKPQGVILWSQSCDKLAKNRILQHLGMLRMYRLWMLVLPPCQHCPPVAQVAAGWHCLQKS